MCTIIHPFWIHSSIGAVQCVYFTLYFITIYTVIYTTFFLSWIHIYSGKISLQCLHAIFFITLFSVSHIHCYSYIFSSTQVWIYLYFAVDKNVSTTTTRLCLHFLHRISCSPAFRALVHPYAAQPYVERKTTKGRHVPAHLTAHVRRLARRSRKQRTLSTIIIHTGQLFISLWF